MNKSLLPQLYIFLLSVLAFNCFSQSYPFNKHEIIFSSIKGAESKPDTITLDPNSASGSGSVKIEGKHAGYFKMATPETESETNIVLIFSPPETFVGIARARLVLKNHQEEIDLTGLSTNGLEGENEAPLAQIVEALGFSTDVGWTSLPNHCRPDLQGEELKPSLFTKANQGEVEMIPVARYSPDFPVNFGFYTIANTGPVQHQSGILAKADDFPEHQTLFPSIAVGKTTFDPGDASFGFYTISPEHTIYSEDIWNILFYPSHVSHAMRVFPVNDKNGDPLKNTYLVCMEEASNGDYNDYVFVVKNVKPVFIEHEFSSLMNGKDLDGWYTWLESKGKNHDPEQIFTVENDGVIHDLGKELGYIMTEKSFDNYHFTLEFKWGEKKWPPRENDKRDSGICYNIPENEPDDIWPQSVECQIQEGDVGDFWLLGYSTIQVDGKQNPPLRHSRITKKKDSEKPSGEWNTVEVISFNGKCVHIVNDVVVNYGENSSLIGGKILLQSEYAEIYYRNIRIREL